MAKKPDMTVVKDFLFRYGERVALVVCGGVALLLLVMGVMDASGPGTPAGDSWDNTLKNSAKPINAKLNSGINPEAVDGVKKAFKAEPTDWNRVDSRVSLGAYITGGENFVIGRNSPLILSVLREPKYFQMDYVYRGHIGYEVKPNGVSAVGDGGAAAPKGPGGGFGPGMPGGNAGNDANLAHVLKPKHMLIVTGIFPMKKQVEEYVKALRVLDAGALIATREMPVPVGINVFRLVFGPDGKQLTKDPQSFIYYDKDMKPNLYVDQTLNDELAEAIIDTANPHRYKPLIHEGLVTPLPKLPDDVKYPDIHVQSDYWPDVKEMVADSSDMPAGPSGGGGMPASGGGGGLMPKGGSGGKTGSGSILGGGGNKNPPPGGGQPMGSDQEQSSEVPTKLLKWADLEKSSPELAKRLKNHQINIFHPLGQFPDSNEERFGFSALLDGASGTGLGGPGGLSGQGSGRPGSPVGGAPGTPGMPKSGSGNKGLGGSGAPKPPTGGNEPGMPTTSSSGLAHIHDAIVRFVDLDVKPGYRYRYYIQVRFQNPNYGRKEDVTQRLFADLKELVSEGEWTQTPDYSIPVSYRLFAVDQFQHDHMGEKDPRVIQYKKNNVKEFRPPDDQQHPYAVLQLHRWFGQTDFRIGDWAIVERLSVRKGESIGGQEMIVEIPTWSDGKGTYEIRHTTPPPVKGKAAPRPVAGVPLDFVPLVSSPDGRRRDPIPPVLVDFEGGRRTRLGIIEEASVDVLILTPEGRLIVRNSRADMDAKIDADTPLESTRQKRVEDWRRRNREVAGGGSGGAGGGAPPILGGK
jgi:hypothetical protein